MKKYIFYLLVIYYSINCQIYAQNYPRIKNAKINCNINLSSLDKLFYYNYVVGNDISSTGDLCSIDIDISLINNMSVDTIGLLFNNDLERTFFKLDYTDLKGKIVPTGVSSTHAGWIEQLTQQYTFSFFCFPGIKPGQSLNNFGINSFGLPSIRSVIFSIAEDTVIDSWPSIEDTTSTLTIAQMDSILASLDYNSWTVGPNYFPKSTTTPSILDTLNYYVQKSFQLGWIKNQSTVNKYTTYFDTAITQLQQNNTAGARTTLNSVLNNVNLDSTSNLTSEAYALIRYNTEYLLTQLPNTRLAVKLVNSLNVNLTTGSLQYYDSTWQNAVNNNDGTFLVNTTLKKVNLKMTYANGTQTMTNVPVGSDTVVFKTVNTSVQLIDSRGNPLDTGTVQYYAGGWVNFGATANGIANMELLPNNYKFRMTYAYASNDTQQNTGINPNVVFRTVNTAVQLKNSLGASIDTGKVQYYAGAWRSFGATANGIANMELLPNSYKFRMTYKYVSEDTTQNTGISNVVNFSTVLCTISVKDSLGQPVNNADTKYYAGAWREIGLTSGGIAAMELLPVNLSFRVKSGKTQLDMTQNLAVNNVVQFILP
jgi:hypothetical protein